MTASTLNGAIRPDTARELSRAAKQAQAFLARRNALIAQAKEEGGSLREIGRLADLTHRSVSKIIERQRP